MENTEVQEQELNQETTNTVEENQTEELTLENASAEDLAQYNSYEEYLASLNQEEPNTETTTDIGSNTEDETQSNSTETNEPTEPNPDEMSDAEFRQFITSTFRANHRDVQVSDPNDIRKLMQYGMNFHKKMAELAPHRKILKALEQNGLTDESKVNFAIELMQGKPEAIAQLLKQHEVDTYNLPDLEENPYQANDYLPSDAKVIFDETIEEIKASVKGNEVIQYLKGLDDESFSEVYVNPVMVKNLAIHAETGLLQDALAMLETERALGKVPAGIKDIDAYAHVAQHLEQQYPEKYKPSYAQPKTQKVIGNNLVQSSQPVQTNNAKNRASIPNNTQTKQQQQSYSGIDALLNASAEELNKYANWEDFLAKNNLNFQ